MKTLNCTACVVGLLTLAGISAADEPRTQEAPNVTVDIAKQPLRKALSEFAQQTGVQLLFSEDEVPVHANARQLTGTYTLQQALGELLAPAALRAQFINSRTIVIRPVNPAEAIGRNAGSAVIAHLAQLNPAAPGEGSEADPAANSPADSQEQMRLEEIVVTAQKREERLVDVPLSMTVVGGDSLDQSNIQGVGEALNRVPGVNNVVGGGTVRAGLSLGSIIVRGAAPITGGPTTAYYLDTLPVSGAVDAGAYDLSRIEVLRGPQGTLYGANAFNGAVRILTQEPNLDDLEFKARTSTSSTEGGSESYRGDAALNVPIIDGKLAVRAVVGHQFLGGWLDQPNDKDANSTEIGNYRVRIGAQPMERLSVDVLTWIYRGKQNAPSNSPDGRTNPSVEDEVAVNEFDLLGFTAGYDFDGFTFTSATSHMDYRNDGRFDYRPFTGNNRRFLNFKFDNEVFSEEISLASTGQGDWRWSLGAMYREAEQYDYSLRTDPATGAIASPYLAPGISTNTSESYALFGELTRVLFDGRLELTAGLRHFHDEVVIREISSLGYVGGVPPTGLYRADGEFEHVSPRFVATWHPNKDSTLYASYGQGFRSGLVQTGAVARQYNFPDADPDTLSNYEIGYKASAWGGRLNVESAIFYMDWQDVQQNQTVYIVPPTNIPGDPNENGVVAGANLNTGSASGLGIEGGISAEVIDGLLLSASFSWNDLRLNQDVLDGAVTRRYAKGDRLEFSPEYTLAAGLDYSFPLGVSGLGGRFSAGASYIPKHVAANLPLLSYQEAALNLRASFAVEGKHWTASLFGENLADESGLVEDPYRAGTKLPNGTVAPNTYMRPRTIGVQLEYRFGRH